MKTRFKVGDKVVSKAYGEGVVVSTDSLWDCAEGYIYPVEVLHTYEGLEDTQNYQSNGWFRKERKDPEYDITLLSPRKTKRFKTII